MSHSEPEVALTAMRRIAMRLSDMVRTAFLCVILGAACSSEVVALEGGEGSPCTPAGGGAGKRCPGPTGELLCASLSDPDYGCASDACAPCSLPHTIGRTCLPPDGMCVVAACATGFQDCNAIPGDGCEANMNVDVNHCGMCTVDCNSILQTSPAAQNVESVKCVSGNCRPNVCSAGFVDCDTVLTNGCETDASLGCSP